MNRVFAKTFSMLFLKAVETFEQELLPTIYTEPPEEPPTHHQQNTGNLALAVSTPPTDHQSSVIAQPSTIPTYSVPDLTTVQEPATPSISVVDLDDIPGCTHTLIYACNLSNFKTYIMYQTPSDYS